MSPGATRIGGVIKKKNVFRQSREEFAEALNLNKLNSSSEYG